MLAGSPSFAAPQGATMTAAGYATEAAQSDVPTHDSNCCILGPQSAGLSIQCQPLAARGGNDIMWPATVREISAERVAIVLQRRFEPQTSLSLSLPEPDFRSCCSVFARVIRVETLGDQQWLLDCMFVSPITGERLNALRGGADYLPQTGGPKLKTEVTMVDGFGRSVVDGVPLRQSLPAGL